MLAQMLGTPRLIFNDTSLSMIVFFEVNVFQTEEDGGNLPTVLTSLTIHSYPVRCPSLPQSNVVYLHKYVLSLFTGSCVALIIE